MAVNFRLYTILQQEKNYLIKDALDQLGNSPGGED
jgi:hypothetical protein